MVITTKFIESKLYVGTYRGLAIDLQSYLVFLETRKKDVRRIARHSRGEFQFEDVQGEIWLIADELSTKRNTLIDFLNPEDQNLLIAHAYQKLVRYCETNVRYAARLDDTGSDEGRPDYANKLTYGEIEDPLNQLVIEANKPSETLERHSLGDAWVAVLDHCNNKMTAVAYFLKISLSHSYRCFNQALHTARTQHPLPLYLPHNIPLNLRPWRPFRRYRRPEQLSFEFDEELPFR